MFRSKNRMILSYLLRRRVSGLTKRGWVVRFQGHPWTLGMFILGDIWNEMGGGLYLKALPGTDLRIVLV